MVGPRGGGGRRKDKKGNRVSSERWPRKIMINPQTRTTGVQSKAREGKGGAQEAEEAVNMFYVPLKSVSTIFPQREGRVSLQSFPEISYQSQ